MAEQISFTRQIADELLEQEYHKSCCKKALLCGLLYKCERLGDKREYLTSFYRLEDAERTASLIDSSFFTGVPTEIASTAKGGHRAYSISFSSKALTGVFHDIDSGKKADLPSAVGFRCPSCMNAFFTGAFIATATVSRPKSGYHMELVVNNEQRAKLLSDLLSDNIYAPGKIRRSTRIGLYYKSNNKIADVLYFLGAPRASFVVADKAVERDIINRENRATNCVTSNISRSVEATKKQLAAIRFIIDEDKTNRLGQELEYTAKLRLEYDSASLSELAMMHIPPISKSGLNSRLARIVAIADELAEEKKNNISK